MLWQSNPVNSLLTLDFAMNFLRLVMIASVFGLAASATLAQTRQLASISETPLAATSAPVLSEARPPIGWTDFCIRHPGECVSDDVSERSLQLTKSIWSMITRTNMMVNARIRQAEDIDVYGVAEFWDYPTKNIGDCEDFALLKRKILMSMGVPRQSLLMTVVRDHEGLGHAVLTIVTDRGDFILDNKINAVLPWAETGYSFVKRQSQTRTDQWVRVGEPSTLATTAAGH